MKRRAGDRRREGRGKTEWERNDGGNNVEE